MSTPTLSVPTHRSGPTTPREISGSVPDPIQAHYLLWVLAIGEAVVPRDAVEDEGDELIRPMSACVISSVATALEEGPTSL